MMIAYKPVESAIVTLNAFQDNNTKKFHGHGVGNVALNIVDEDDPIK